MRIELIRRYVPESLFIVISRDEIENAQSLLAARKKVHGNFDTWWSVPTPSMSKIIREPGEVQVIEQIREIRAVINRDLEMLDRTGCNVLETGYEDLCFEPHRELLRVEEFLRMNGSKVVANLASLPSRFERSENISIPKHVYRNLVDYAKSSSAR
jgi:hypothetical protein